jgi:hypothetical protein
VYIAGIFTLLGLRSIAAMPTSIMVLSAARLFFIAGWFRLVVLLIESVSLPIGIAVLFRRPWALPWMRPYIVLRLVLGFVAVVSCSIVLWLQRSMPAQMAEARSLSGAGFIHALSGGQFYTIFVNFIEMFALLWFYNCGALRSAATHSES